MKKFKICVITGTRAEYGLLKNLMKKIKENKKFLLQIIVTGSHLSSLHGNTYREIVNDGFTINSKCNILAKSDSEFAIVKSMSKAMELISNSLKVLKPNIVMMLGDRYELLSAAACCNIMKLPIAHIHGGETTEGAFDEAIRHSITKMSHIHFVAHADYRKRVIQLGENPKNVYNVGGLGVDNLSKIDLLSKNQLSKSLKIKFNKKNLLVTYHPETLSNFNEKKHIKNLLEVLKTLKDTNIFFTMPNADTNNKIIFNLINIFCKKNKNSFVFKSLGQLRYYSMLQYVDIVIGNSSSGLLEVPSFRIGTINIGDRQKGRIQSKSVINCEPNKISITKALKTAYSKKFLDKLKKSINPYGPKGAAEKIIKILESIDKVKIKKHFYDISI
tara:strand:+ start:2059 stop:3219 length:1161 start_codon:yes stop_codon:yes gene_type:complete